MSVTAKTKQIDRLHVNCKLIDTVAGGTETMRDAGKAYLPKWPLESDAGYKNRLDTATMYPALSETIKQMSGRVFFKPMDRTEVNENLGQYIDDIDMKGNNIDVFASRVFNDAISYGLSFVVIDYTGTGAYKNLKEEKTSGARPFAVKIKPDDVLGYRTAIINGKEQVTQFRYQRIITETVDEFEEKEIKEIVVLDIGRVRKYRETEKSEWGLYSDQELKANGKILNRVNVVMVLFSDKPPLLDLAYLNIKHWQSQSDQDTILHTARVPLLARIGVEATEENFQISGSIVDLPENADLKYVEHSGASIKAGEESIVKLEEQIQAAGAKLLTRSKIALTESQSKDEQNKEISILRLYANYLEDSLAQVLDIFGLWVGIVDGGKLEISGNIDSDMDPNATMDTLIKLNQQGVISKQTVYEEAQNRGLISPLQEWEAEQVRIDSNLTI